MDPMVDVALLQVVVLQQDLLERDVDKARDPFMGGSGEQEAVWTLRQTDG